MTDFVDRPEAPRESERLPLEALEAWLRSELPGFDGALTVEQFRKGHSNLTYAISDGVRSWVLRRGPFGSTVETAHDMSREHRILRGLGEVYPPAPRALAFCEDPAVLGAPFYVMERVEGVILRGRVPRGLTWSEQSGAELSSALVDELVRIHSVDLDAAGLDTLGKPDGYTRRQVEGWTARYDRARTDEIAEMEAVAAWLADKLPAGDEGVLIHNDFKHDNVVLDPNDLSRVVGVLDWEMATVGHPLMDLGTTLGYWVSPDDGPEMAMMPFGVGGIAGSWNRRQVIDAYAERSGRDLSQIDFYHVFGLFKIAVVAQQIYYRFHTGKTDDPRFQMMIVGVRALSAFAKSIVDKSTL